MQKKKSSKSNTMKRQISFSYLQIGMMALLFAAIGIFVVMQSFAARPSRAVLTGPPSLTAGSNYTVVGTGFKPNTIVALEQAAANGCCSAFNTYADSEGKFTYTGNAYAPGYYRLRASESSHNRWRVVASWEADAQ